MRGWSGTFLESITESDLYVRITVEIPSLSGDINTCPHYEQSFQLNGYCVRG